MKINLRNSPRKKSYSAKFNSENLKKLGTPLIKKGFRTGTKNSTSKSRKK